MEVGGRFVNEKMLRVADAADALAFGSPTYMGGPAAQFKTFANATSERWAEMRWTDKVAAGFTTSSCANGDQGHTLAYFTVLAGQHGMLWSGPDIPGGMDPKGRNRLSSGLGMAAHAVDRALDGIVRLMTEGCRSFTADQVLTRWRPRRQLHARCGRRCRGRHGAGRRSGGGGEAGSGCGCGRGPRGSAARAVLT